VRPLSSWPVQTAGLQNNLTRRDARASAATVTRRDAMASAATVPSPPRQRVLTFAERQHLSDQRRAAVLAQRQAERAKGGPGVAAHREQRVAGLRPDGLRRAPGRGHRGREARGSYQEEELRALRGRRRAARARAASRLLSDDARDADLPDVTCPAGVALAAAVGARVDAPDGLLLLAAAPR
jgi:hypothetical protein